MKASKVAALALLIPASLAAQGVADLSIATPAEGSWTYAATSDGSEARFANAFGAVQVTFQCKRTTRRVSIAKPGGAAAPFIEIWTSSLKRSVPSSFNPATGRLTIELAPYDPLLDAIASSRGRVAFTTAAQPPLVLPAWPEASRVIEDCRA